MTAKPQSILLIGDPRLRQISAPVTAIDAALKREIEALFATLAQFRQEHGFGRAIAAPQVGIAKRMIAMDLGDGPFMVINPEIAWASSEMFTLWDDCMSLPGVLIKVRRHRSVTVDYVNENFDRAVFKEAPPELAELLQHEIDHLDGVLFSDRMTEDKAVIASAMRDVAAPEPTMPNPATQNPAT